jgi:hypothetical protein
MRLYLPGCTVSTATRACPTANQVAIDPLTGYKTFFALQGTFVPASVGGYATSPNPFPGMERATENNPNLPLTLWTVPSLLPAFRFGLAWGVFGNGRTAIRTGFGQFYNTPSTQIAQNSSGNPPDTSIGRSITPRWTRSRAWRRAPAFPRSRRTAPLAVRRS